MKCQHVNDLMTGAEMAGKTKAMQQLNAEKPIAENVDMLTREAADLLDEISCPVIDLQPEDLSKRFSANFLPSLGPISANDLSPKQVLDAINSQFPKKWLKQIEIEWR